MQRYYYHGKGKTRKRLYTFEYHNLRHLKRVGKGLSLPRLTTDCITSESGNNSDTTSK